MEASNPYLPPTAPLDHPGTDEVGPRMPWEDSVAYPAFADRVLATLGILLRPTQAGAALGAGRRLGPAIAFYALVGFPLVWLVQVLAAVLRPGAPLPWMGWFGLPKMPAPTPEAVGLQRTIALAGALAAPVTLAVSLAVTGAVNHVGLWLTRGLRHHLGIEVTYRTILYAHGALGLVGSVFALWPLLPPVAAMILFVLLAAFWIAAAVYQGVLLARAHRTESWRGVLGVFLPWILLGCCCGLLGLALATATGAFKGAFR